MNYCNPEGWKNEIKHLRNTATRNQFFVYFDGPREGSIDDVFSKSYDVFDRVFLPYAMKYLKDLENKISLDIGYGSGGQVLAASKVFGTSIGIDVHEETDIISNELKSRKAGRFKLMVGNGKDLSNIGNEMVDFVHSWVTFLHLPTIDYVHGYLKEIKRVLKPGGIGVVYFSRLLRSSKNQTWEELSEDIEKEKYDVNGYREGGAKSKVRSVSLQIAMWKMEDILKTLDFGILDYTASFDYTKHNDKIFHGQYGMVFIKPKPVIVSEGPVKSRRRRLSGKK